MNLSFTLSIIINLKFIAPKLLKNIETSKKTFQHPNLYITNCNYSQTKKHCPALAGGRTVLNISSLVFTRGYGHVVSELEQILSRSIQPVYRPSSVTTFTHLPRTASGWRRIWSL